MKKQVLEFPVGTPVIVKRGGKWSGTVTSYGRDATNFLHDADELQLGAL